MFRSSRQSLCAAAVTVLVAVTFAIPARAADHLEAPIVAQDLGADIGDVYFFLDPNDNNFAVMAMTVHGYIVPSQNAHAGFFDHTLRFRFQIENTGGATADRFIDVTHSKQTSRTVPQAATIKVSAVPTLLPNGRTFNAPTTISRGAFGPPGPPTFGGGTSAQQISTVTTDAVSKISYFGGLIDDPFFFDLGAEQAYRASRFANQTNPAILTRGRDSFAGTNTLVVVLRAPVALLKGTAGNVVGLTGLTQRKDVTDLDTQNPANDKTTGSYANIDRMATPMVNTMFTSYPNKDAYNRANTQDDAAGKFAGDIVQTLQNLQTAPAQINILAQIAVLNGDILRLDTTIPNTGPEGGTNSAAAFPNGRRPNDDVIDTMLTLVNSGVFQGDAVNDNELPMRGAFPFFAQPHMPFPPGAGSEDLTRN